MAVVSQSQRTATSLGAVLDGGLVRAANQPIVARRELVQRSNVPFGNYEHVHRRLRVDVLERHHLIVLVDDRAGDQAIHDLAEETVLHVHLRAACCSTATLGMPARSSTISMTHPVRSADARSARS